MIADVERAVLPYPPEALFALVADVAQFPRYLPLVRAARITAQDQDGVEAELLLSQGPISRRIKSRSTFDPPHSITVRCEDAWLERCEQSWRFNPVAGGTEVTFSCQIEPKGPLGRILLSANLHHQAALMLNAFTQEANRRLHKARQPSDAST